VRRIYPFVNLASKSFKSHVTITESTEAIPKPSSEETGYFEVSPHGTYVLSIKDNAYLCRKYL